MKPLRVLDLCSGLEGWSAPWRTRGHDVTSVDIEPSFHPDIVADVTVIEFDHGEFDVILASPPCELFSTAGWHRHAWAMTGDKRNGTNRYRPTKPEAVTALEIVRAVRRIVADVKPSAAIVENPRALLRQLGELPGPPTTVWYCHYGEDRAKPTDLWRYGLASALRLRPECHNRRDHHSRSCCCRDHNAAPRGSITGTQGMASDLAAKIPAQLARAVMLGLERRLDGGR